MITLWMALAGGLGAMARFVVDGLIRERWSRSFPLATLVINVTGSLMFGILTGLVLYQHASTDVRLVVGTGFCGGYTTFSTASFETVRLLQRQSVGLALANGLGTVLLTLGAAALGMVVVQ